MVASIILRIRQRGRDRIQPRAGEHRERYTTIRWGVSFVIAWIMWLPVAVAVPLTADDVDYEREIRPLLAQKCAACHGALRQAGGLRLDYGAAIHQGGESGAAILPKQAAESLILQKVSAADDGGDRMPPVGEGERLNAAQIELLKRWVEAGATFPADEEIPSDPAQWWSYQKVVRPEVPNVNDNPWVRTPIDAFIVQKQQEHGIFYNTAARPEAETRPEAEKRPGTEARPEVLLRRVYLDLIGVPPTREELLSYLADGSADRYERKVDELLSRPEYGQRWGRHWMDVWRYSDWYGSRGINEIRYSQRHIWRWRDWIVESLNEDKPYNQMILEMVAGDELAPADPNVLRATGFLGRNWYKFDRNVWMFETVEQTSQAFLGMTIRCARCHDHKYDPITQAEYYQFRSFFEAHDVRTDPVSGNLLTEKDATLGEVFREGVSRVFDKDPGAPTYLFARGDNRYPDTTRAMTPAVPAALGGTIDVRPVTLPAEAWYPQLRPDVTAGMTASAEQKVDDAKAALVKATQQIHQAENAVSQRLAEVDIVQERADADSFILDDTFDEKSPQWQVLNGDWNWSDGRLTQSSVTSFATIVASPILPANFKARVRYRTLAPGSYRSVGLSFDYIDQGNSQDVYTSTGDSAQSVQAFHRLNGQQHYPAAGIVPVELKVGDETVVEITVREQNLTIHLNGVEKLSYVMPTPRREGKLALWVHQGSAEFLDVHVSTLIPTIEDLQAAVRYAKSAAEIALARVHVAEAEADSIRKRINAERAKYGLNSAEHHGELAIEAARAEKQIQIAKVREELIAAEHHLAEVHRKREMRGKGEMQGQGEVKSPVGSTLPVDAEKVEAEKKVSEIRDRIAGLESERQSIGSEYAPLGTTYPQTSSGRRLALARWISSPENPRTARIAVNHIWLRHFGEAFVPTVANFGLNGAKPSHPELLDWLSAEFIENGWSMKTLHRMIVVSSVYRQSTASASPEFAVSDSSNRWLWRMNSRRMEAEVVRDSILQVAGKLDVSMSGPEIPETEVQNVLRRSLYFRNTPNEKSILLESFDVANPNECYRRQESVIPQQALTMMNSGLAIDAARSLAESLTAKSATESRVEEGLAGDAGFIRLAFETVLSRPPSTEETALCEEFLNNTTSSLVTPSGEVFPAGQQTARRQPSSDPQQRARENLVLVLLSHNDFVTIR